MAVDKQAASASMRTTFFDSVVKGFATAMYKFKQAVTISPTSAWKNYYWRESPTALSSPAGNNIKGIPRGATFPQAVVEWERISTTIDKYGLEDNIPWEDLISDDIDVRDRTLFRIAEGVTKAVDDEIWDVLTESQSATNIQSVNVAQSDVAGAAWNESSAAIIDDLMQGKQKIAEQNYDTGNLMLFVSTRDHRSIIKYLTDKGAQFPSLSTGVAKNGHVGNLAGVNIVMSNSVSASYALLCVPKVCGTWKELVPLQTTTKEDPYKSLTVRSVEMGVTQLTDPKACVLMVGTQRSTGGTPV